MSNNIFNVDFLDFLELLEKHKVEFLLVGGYAVILHGYIRSTGDIDLWIEQTNDNYQKIKKVYLTKVIDENNNRNIVICGKDLFELYDINNLVSIQSGSALAKDFAPRGAYAINV